MKTTFTVLVLLLMFVSHGISQDKPPKKDQDRKGTFYMYWGWNYGWYTNSDIHFKGDQYDFTLYDVEANDRQSPFGWDPYFKINQITIPQYNFRLGYFFNNNYSLSIGVDHMKYVMVEYQTVKISGSIDTSYSSLYGGTYDNDDIVVANSLLTYEHTDGLNYLNIELRRHDEIYKYKNIGINVSEGFGAGLLMPKTNAMFMGNKRYDEFHVAGFGLGAVVALNVTFWKYVFIQGEFKAGYINMPDVRITSSKADKASQSFWFTELMGVIGVKYNFSANKK